MKIAAKLSFIFLTAIAGEQLAMANSVYKTVDENGRVTYSDNPSGQKIDAVELPTINTTPAIETSTYVPTTRIATEQISVAITDPANGFQVLPGQRDLLVNTRISPALSDGHQVQLLIDNKPFGSPQSSEQFVITDILRGEHNLSVVVLNSNGQIVARAPAVTVYVLRPNAR